MRQTLSGRKVAILAINGFDRHRFSKARARLVEAGAITTVVSSARDDLICSWHPSSNGVYTTVDRHVRDVHPAYDALFLPGTVVDPEAVFVDPWTADFVKSFFDLGRPIASLCRDRWLLVHRNNIFGGRLHPEPLFSSEIVLPQSTSASNADPCGSHRDLDGFIREMLTFYQTSLARTSRSIMPCEPAGQIRDGGAPGAMPVLLEQAVAHDRGPDYP